MLGVSQSTVSRHLAQPQVLAKETQNGYGCCHQTWLHTECHRSWAHFQSLRLSQS
ncbi:hypothetical protein O9993_03485 [Vibrio lentus]|nr:hypothetical protein [Vibrio lentus]